MSYLAAFASLARSRRTGDARREAKAGRQLVEFDVIPTLDAFVGLKLFLEDQLGHKVDLVTADALKPRMRPAVEREAVTVT